MSVTQTQSKRFPSGLIILVLLVIGLCARTYAQAYDYPNPDSDTAEDAIEEYLRTIKEEREAAAAPDNVEATPGGDPETEAPIEPKVAEIDATAQVQLLSDAPGEDPAEPDATAAVPAKPKKKKKFKKKSKKKKKKKTPKKKTPKRKPVETVPETVEPPTPEPQPVEPQPEPVLPQPEVPEPDETQPLEPEPVVPEPETVAPEPVAPEPVVPEPVVPEPEVPAPVDPEPVAPEPEIPAPIDPEPVVPEPETPAPIEPEPGIPDPVVPEPVIPEPEVPAPIDPEPVVPEPVVPEPKPVEPEEPKPKVERKPATQGPCVDVYSRAQKRQACPGGWKDRVNILNMQVDKLKTDNDKLWMQVTEIHGKIKYSRGMISESHLSTNTWKKRVAFPYDGSKDAIADDITDCEEALSKGHQKPGVYLLNPSGSPYNVRALCVNGWTIVQRRFDGTEDFNREFDDYMAGFGNFSSEFFLGLENLHIMGKSKDYTLRVDAKGSSGKWYYGVYEGFGLTDEKDDYRLSLGNMTAGNYFDGFANSREQQFSTRERDNDNWRGGNCAAHYGGGWWSNECITNLNQMWCKAGCLRWADKRVISSIIRIKPSAAVVAEDLSENPNPGGLSLDEVPA